MVKDDYIILCL